MRLGFGNVVFISEWPAEAKVEIDLDTIQKMNRFAKDVQTLVVADEGRSQLQSLTQDQIRQSVKTLAARQPGAPSNRPATPRPGQRLIH